jgi:hypothetical protein
VSNSDANNGFSAMEGGGFYNRHSAMQAAGITLLSPIWETMCRTVKIGDGPLTIVDYGSSQGRNSMAPIRIAIEELRKRAGSAVPIEVIHTDLPSNDFSALFEALQKEPSSYMVAMPGVFPAAIGRTFFDPLLPPERVHLGWTTWAMQWMSRSPADAPDHILAGMSKSSHVMAAVKEQQAVDWRRFLELRALEMRPGAKLLAAFTGRTTYESGWEWLLGELWSALCDMAGEGLLSDKEKHQLTIPIGLRTIEDLKAPFIETGRFAELMIEHVEILRVADPYWDDFQCTGDREVFANRHADTTKAWCGPTIARLIDPSRDQTAFLDDLFVRFAQRLSANPKKHQPYMAVIGLAKQLRD